ncbi:MAG TPA: hypothetical protein ENG33_01720 [Chloroflexi bacterium]|nr:hypothetical protein [Chloroflexota bacterium]
MGDVFEVAIPAAIALVGTIITVAIGYYQWRRKQDLASYGAFQSEKRAIYKELWRMLENVHIKLRVDTVSWDEFHVLLREVNSYILKHSLYLDEQDRILANRYLDSLWELKRLITRSGDEEAERDWCATRTIPPEVIERVQEIGYVQDEVSQIRKELIKRFRKAIGGDFLR